MQIIQVFGFPDFLFPFSEPTFFDNLTVDEQLQLLKGENSRTYGSKHMHQFSLPGF